MTGKLPRGQAEECLGKRKQLMEQVKARNPERWGSRTTRDWSLPNEVWLNPERQEAINEPPTKEVA